MNNTTKELTEISRELSDIDVCEILNKTEQVEAVVNMAKAFIELIGDVPREKEIMDGYFAMLSIIDTLRDRIFVLDDKITKASRRLASIV